ncbi:MAG TPA: 5'/3'-nucleotidase SurE [Planctomycetota bacterium]|nr:5'/3'-nucleotidase SurE [Planctomycetota bacterium]
MKRILFTNDDGLSSPGLTTLVHELQRTGRYDLRVAAPEKEQSGVGHCITIHWPLYAEKVTLPDPISAVPAFKVAGTPADCVKLAITNLFPEFKPDLIISGINRGPNVGMNVLYSGTVAGALEAVINGFPAVALSLDVPASGLWHFALAAELSVPIIDAVVEHGLPEWTALNVNIPNCSQSEIKGVRMTTQGRSGFKEYYVEEAPEGMRRKFRLEGSMFFRDDDAGVDAVALKEKWIACSPLGLSLLSRDAWNSVKQWPLFNQKGR